MTTAMPLRNAFALSVPASSANLGPGFDAVGIALDLRARAIVEPAHHFSIEFSGAEQPTHGGFEGMLLDAMHSVNHELPRVRVQLVNAIPLGKGLGSSAAARVLGVTIAARAHGLELDRDAVAHRACELEGHPDNALPAVYGGIAIATSSHANASIKLAAPRELRAIVVVPEFDLATTHARALLPLQHDKTDVVFNMQRAALLGAALASGNWNVCAKRCATVSINRIARPSSPAWPRRSPSMHAICSASPCPAPGRACSRSSTHVPHGARSPRASRPPLPPPGSQAGATGCPSPRAA